MKAYMILGGQWGSEGKGLFAGYMARQKDPDGAVCQFGPNAGHTWLENGQPIVFKSLPVASIAPSVRRVFLGPGSVINPAILKSELEQLSTLLNEKEIYIHEAAAILEPGDAESENDVTHIASTRQGTSEAMIRKIRRQCSYRAATALSDLPVSVVGDRYYTDALHHACKLVQVEGAQGMDLSINSGMYYPYVTSRDCTPAQVLADCGIHPYNLAEIYACLRTFPIRVGHIYDEQGVRIGYSGPCYADQYELTWEELGQKAEYTTVTKRVRRVFTFSQLQLSKLMALVRPSAVFLNFANYLPEDKLDDLIDRIHLTAGVAIVRWTGHGPDAGDVVDQQRPRVSIKPPEYGESI